MGVQLGAVFGPMEQWTPPIVSESELLAARLDLVLGALADLSGTLRALPAPQVHLEAPDLSAIVTAVNSLKPSVGADEIAAAVRETLTPSLLPAEPADDSTLRALADTLTKLEFRLRAAGNHTAAITLPNDPTRQVGQVSSLPPTGAFGYTAGVSGTPTVPGTARVQTITAHCTTAGSLTINGGASIPIPANSSFSASYTDTKLVAPALVFTGTDSYYLDWLV